MNGAGFAGADSKDDLLKILEQLIVDSGGETTMSELSAWLDAWLAEPLPQLHGATPAQALRSADGWEQVVDLLERMRGGLLG